MFRCLRNLKLLYSTMTCSFCHEKLISLNQRLFWRKIKSSIFSYYSSETLNAQHFIQFHRKQKFYNKHLTSFISLSLGIAVGISSHKLLIHYNNNNNNYYYSNYITNKLKHVSLYSLVPSAAAASFFSNLSEEGLGKKPTELKLANRKNHNFIADVVEKVSDGVVLIEIKDDRRTDHTGKRLNISNGSGFIVDSKGLILTNAHVVANKPRAASIMIRLSDGEEYQGTVEELDVISDLALVRIHANSKLKALNLGSSKDIRPGEFVVALGCPLSLTNTITSGVVSSVGRTSKDLGLRGRDIDYIQTDAAITFGNSGGPLVNLDGEVIGINSMKVTSGISFAIPIDYAKMFLEKAEKKRSFLAKHKSEDREEIGIKRRYLGITMLTLTPEIILQMQQRSPGSPAYQLPANLTQGILVWRIVVGSPAYNAGLEPGDIITRINGTDVQSSRDVYKLLETKADLKMVIVRKGQAYTVTITPED